MDKTNNNSADEQILIEEILTDKYHDWEDWELNNQFEEYQKAEQLFRERMNDLNDELSEFGFYVGFPEQSSEERYTIRTISERGFMCEHVRNLLAKYGLKIIDCNVFEKEQQSPCFQWTVLEI